MKNGLVKAAKIAGRIFGAGATASLVLSCATQGSHDEIHQWERQFTKSAIIQTYQRLFVYSQGVFPDKEVSPTSIYDLAQALMLKQNPDSGFEPGVHWYPSGWEEHQIAKIIKEMAGSDNVITGEEFDTAVEKYKSISKQR